MKENTKEHIKNRMIKKAASLWGVSPNEIDMSFDPIVSMLISACAFEIEKIAAEVDDSQTRITEKVIQLMTPETVNGPRPAHGIVYAEASDDKSLIKPEYLFNYRKQEVHNKTSLKYKDIYFSPIQDFNLVNAKIQFIATGDMVYELDTKKGRQIVGQNLKNSKLLPSTLYIAISSELKNIRLDDVSFYFELLGVENKELFYHHLRNADWHVENGKLKVISGFFNSDDGHLVKLNSIFEDISNKTHNTSQQILNSCIRYYVTVKSMNEGKELASSSFKEVQDLFEENKIKTEGDLRWIKIVFPRIISNDFLKHIHCSLNAFPVMNRELKSFSYRIKEYINILPIKTEELFFDIKSIVNTEGKEYRARSKNNSGDDKGTFVLRSDNVGKLDKRKAREYIIHLIELLKDESASFSFLNNDFLRKNLESLNQLISLLESKVSESSNETTQTNYVVLRPFNSNENLIVDYWTTNGIDGNNIKSGSELSLYKGVGVKQGNSHFLTTTYGGRDDLAMKDRLNSYRRSLLSRDRIVTKEDVKALCFEIYADRISKVDVKRGFSEAIDLNKGMIQCIEILLTPNNQINTETEEWESINSNLLYFLEKNSINVFPFKIKILN